MRQKPTQPDKRPAAAASSATESAARPESETLSGREKLEDTLGGAISRVLSRAGLGVRVVAKATESDSAEPEQTAPAGSSRSPAVARSPEPAKASLPARDELITLLTLVLGSQLLQKHAADAHADNSTPAATPAAPTDPLSGTPWQAAPSPPVTGPPLPGRPLPRPPAAGATASPSNGKAAPPTKGRGFTIRY